MVLKKRGLFEYVAKDLATKIFAGEVKPGGKLSTEHQLCEEFGVSRTVIRDALRILKSKGLIESRPHSGTIVRSVEHWNFLDSEMISWARDMEDREGFFDMLMEARFVLEPQVVEIAALKATDAEIERLDKACTAMETAADAVPQDLKGFNDADIDFHLTMLDATHNLILRQFGDVIKVALQASFEIALTEAELSMDSVHAHRSMAEAVRNRDPKAARRGMEIVSSILIERIGRGRDVAKD